MVMEMSCRIVVVQLLVAVLLLLLSKHQQVRAHSRWVCPPPRNPDTAIKSGPCGLETNQFVTSSSDPIIVVQPGPLLVQWEESIFHTGAPFRIALSQDGSDIGEGNGPCVLLDHIPHFDTPATFPTFGSDATYILYTLTINIPDVQCTQCSLHLANPMTDKIGDDGTPNGIGCTDPSGTCFSVYHSCTIPISINGTQVRSQYTCPNTNPTDWPTSWDGDNGLEVDATTMGVYRRESAVWEQSFLMDAPDSYRTIVTNENQLSCTKSDLFPQQVIPTTSPISPLPTSTSPIPQPTTTSPIPPPPTTTFPTSPPSTTTSPSPTQPTTTSPIPTPPTTSSSSRSPITISPTTSKPTTTSPIPPPPTTTSSSSSPVTKSPTTDTPTISTNITSSAVQFNDCIILRVIFLCLYTIHSIFF